MQGPPNFTSTPRNHSSTNSSFFSWLSPRSLPSLNPGSWLQFSQNTVPPSALFPRSRSGQSARDDQASEKEKKRSSDVSSRTASLEGFDPCERELTKVASEFEFTENASLRFTEAVDKIFDVIYKSSIQDALESMECREAFSTLMKWALHFKNLDLSAGHEFFFERINARFIERQNPPGLHSHFANICYSEQRKFEVSLINKVFGQSISIADLSPQQHQLLDFIKSALARYQVEFCARELKDIQNTKSQRLVRWRNYLDQVYENYLKHTNLPYANQALALRRALNIELVGRVLQKAKVDTNDNLRYAVFAHVICRAVPPGITLEIPESQINTRPIEVQKFASRDTIVERNEWYDPEFFSNRAVLIEHGDDQTNLIYDLIDQVAPSLVKLRKVERTFIVENASSEALIHLHEFLTKNQLSQMGTIAKHIQKRNRFAEQISDELKKRFFEYQKDIADFSSKIEMFCATSQLNILALDLGSHQVRLTNLTEVANHFSEFEWGIGMDETELEGLAERLTQAKLSLVMRLNDDAKRYANKQDRNEYLEDSQLRSIDLLTLIKIEKFLTDLGHNFKPIQDELKRWNGGS